MSKKIVIECVDVWCNLINYCFLSGYCFGALILLNIEGSNRDIVRVMMNRYLHCQDF